MDHKVTKAQREEGKAPRDTMDPIVEQTAREVVDAAFTVHKALGPGLLESVYEACLVHECEHRNLHVQRQVQLPIVYRSLRIDSGLRLDLLIESHLIVELKAVEMILPVHHAQLLSYLKIS